VYVESLVGEEGSVGLHGEGQVGEKRVRLGWKRRVHLEMRGMAEPRRRRRRRRRRRGFRSGQEGE
jgi:hypothetical protein